MGRSTAARAGRSASTTTTRSRSKAASALPWVTTSSRRRRTALRPRSSTPSTTRAATTARCASSSTTRRCRTVRAPPPVTEVDVLEVQANWAAAIKSISKIHKEGGDYIAAAGEAAGELYAYGHSNVLFKPTKAAEHQFRPTGEEAMSYFVGGSVVDNGYEEDAGFATNGGKGWSECIYDNHQVELKGGIGVAMGNYFFTSAEDASKTKVEYTFGYTRCDDGKVRIFLHHSSVPYSA